MGGSYHGGGNVAQITLFFPPGGPNPEQRRNSAPGSRDVPSTRSWIRLPQAIYGFKCSLEFGHSFIQRKMGSVAPVYYNLFCSLWLIPVVLFENICIFIILFETKLGGSFLLFFFIVSTISTEIIFCAREEEWSLTHRYTKQTVSLDGQTNFPSRAFLFKYMKQCVKKRMNNSLRVCRSRAKFFCYCVFQFFLLILQKGSGFGLS